MKKLKEKKSIVQSVDVKYIPSDTVDGHPFKAVYSSSKNK